MEEKLSNAESESQILRQQGLEMTKKLSSVETDIHEMREKLKKAKSAIQETTGKFKKAELEIQTLGEQLVTSIRKTKVLLRAGQNHMTEKLKKADSEIHEMTEKLRKAESEIKALRQQMLTMTPIVKSAPRSPENSHAQNGEVTLVMNFDEDFPDYRPQGSLNDKQQDLLIRCISQNLGYSNGKPVAASVIYKCLIHWGSFEMERTSIFDRIVQTIGSAIEVQKNNYTLGYWLSNTSSLLLLLQQTLEGIGATGITPHRRQTSTASLFGRMSSLRESPQIPGLSFFNGRPNKLDDVYQVKAKYPAAWLFKQQLTAFLEKTYVMLRDNLKKNISPRLGYCIQAPRASRARLKRGRTYTNSVAQQALVAHWQSIVKSLNSYLTMMKANNVPPFLVRKVFSQIFSFVDIHLFNSLLLWHECCSFSNGEDVKAGLAELKQWCYDALEEYAGSAWDELKHIRQAVRFLVMYQKPKLTLNEITRDLCPALSIEQLYGISVRYWDDKYGTHTVSSDVLSCMKIQITEDANTAVSNSFLLDEDESIPFSLDDICSSMQPQGAGDIDLPEFLREHSGFSFLIQQSG